MPKPVTGQLRVGYWIKKENKMKVRIEVTTDYAEPIIILTAKEMSCTWPYIGVFTRRESHNEAHPDYIKESCRLPKTEAEKQDCTRILSWYKAYINSLPK